MRNNSINVNVSNDGSTIVVVRNVSTDSSNVLVRNEGLQGKTGVTWKGEFSETEDYYLGDVVSYGGSSYFATTYSTASITTPATSPNFSVLALKGTDGGAGEGGDVRT